MTYHFLSSNFYILKPIFGLLLQSLFLILENGIQSLTSADLSNLKLFRVYTSRQEGYAHSFANQLIMLLISFLVKNTIRSWFKLKVSDEDFYRQLDRNSKYINYVKLYLIWRCPIKKKWMYGHVQIPSETVYR